MAPPTGIKTVIITVWSEGQKTFARLKAPLLPTSRWNPTVEGRSEQEVVERVRRAARAELQAWLEQNEPYYVEVLLESYTEFRVERI